MRNLPSIQQATREGYQARLRGEFKGSCPYSTISPKTAYRWREGWEHANGQIMAKKQGLPSPIDLSKVKPFPIP